MRSHIWSACMIATLLLSFGAFAEIVPIGDEDQGGDPGDITNSWNEAGVYGTASGEDDYIDNWADGWMFTYTTEYAQLYWSCKAYAFTEVELYVWDDDWASASAGGYGSSGCQYGSVSEEAGCSLEESGQGGQRFYAYDIGDEPTGEYKNGWGEFDTWEGVYGDHGATVVAQIEEGSDCIASGHSCVEGWGTLGN